ncbi:hypothetical protein NOR_05546 [Metarhizium rileyi]|uniref:Uncharacterized protein n=1 Tax=Metarhizium rileyi (strain RCEF 4871) TaxID=1649241 RepID=A0A167CAE3_METRR|nr:hypothetical protein NOR_05546 [Metarhizium rileyi RCEF 4871]
MAHGFLPWLPQVGPQRPLSFPCADYPYSFSCKGILHTAGKSLPTRAAAPCEQHIVSKFYDTQFSFALKLEFIMALQLKHEVLAFGSSAPSSEIQPQHAPNGNDPTASSPGNFYTAPDSLRGVPIEKIDESSMYWDSSWDSLNDFLAYEDEERSLKETYRVMREAEPDNMAIRKKVKFHQDNTSKHVKIREIFGPHSPYHPNQLVAKQHLPLRGLCQKEIMYRVACKISDLELLHDRGILTMNAWDFIRWRIGLKIAERLEHPGQNGREFVRTVIYKLCDESRCGFAGYGDPVMRQAVLISAQYQGRLASFKTESTKTCNSGAGLMDSALSWRDANEANGRRRRRNADGSQTGRAITTRRADERRQRRARLAAQSGHYQGVNAFREMQRDRQSH